VFVDRVNLMSASVRNFGTVLYVVWGMARDRVRFRVSSLGDPELQNAERWEVGGGGKPSGVISVS
jgi:hypothetical protein